MFISHTMGKFFNEGQMKDVVNIKSVTVFDLDVQLREKIFARD